jgi:hypothetical protein
MDSEQWTAIGLKLFSCIAAIKFGRATIELMAELSLWQAVNCQLLPQLSTITQTFTFDDFID